MKLTLDQLADTRTYYDQPPVEDMPAVGDTLEWDGELVTVVGYDKTGLTVTLMTESGNHKTVNIFE
jgi:hypothetical protein